MGKNGRRLVPRQPVFLTYCWNGDEDFFARVFIETWRKIPVTGRRAILKAVKPNGLKVRIEPLHDTRAAGQAAYPNEVRFCPRAIDFQPETATQWLTAHELAHIVDFGRMTPWEYAATAESESKAFESRAENLATLWGFRQHGHKTTPDDAVRMTNNVKRWKEIDRQHREAKQRLKRKLKEFRERSE